MRYFTSTFRTLVVFTLCVITSNSFAEVPPGYYDAAVGLKKAELKAAMHDIIKSANVLKYGSGSGATWEGFYKVDRRSDNSVIDRYSYETHYFPSGYSAADGMNIEHSFPKSWWGGSKNQAYQDIHHLMPCESNINSRKGNYVMGVVTTDKNGNGCTKVGTGQGGSKSLTMWEPADEWKGDFARAYFYMATCYSNLTWTSEGLNQLENNEWPTLQKWTYDILLQWNKQDPVDDLERTRNDGVYAIQKNRNPFIDYPDLCDYIWGEKMAEAWNPNGAIVDPIPGTTPDEEESIVFEESLESSLGNFYGSSTSGTAQIWETNASYRCAVANAYSKGKTADEYLISKPGVIDLTDYKSASLSFEHATGFNAYNDASGMFSVVVTEDNGSTISPSLVSWDKLTVPTWPANVSGGYTQFANSGEIDLTPYCGKKIAIGFRYTSNTSSCWAWEVRNVVIKGEKTGATKIFDNWYEDYLNPKQQVYNARGILIGTALPNESGLYIIKTKDKIYKVLK
ncbi:MAG: endonuclease [Bacteroidaceae bacterium]|nr:endonuclease [Bacteroidaceae bacterium]